jgi:ribosome-associated protein
MRDPIRIGPRASVPLREIVVRVSRSSGPGGQHANVTESRVEVSFDVAASESLTDEQKARILSRAGARVTAVAQDARGQARNRELAIERLRQRLEAALAVAPERRGTRPSRSVIERRLEAKRVRASRKRDRRWSAGNDD